MPGPRVHDETRIVQEFREDENYTGTELMFDSQLFLNPKGSLRLTFEVSTFYKHVYNDWLLSSAVDLLLDGTTRRVSDRKLVQNDQLSAALQSPSIRCDNELDTFRKHPAVQAFCEAYFPLLQALHTPEAAGTQFFDGCLISSGDSGDEDNFFSAEFFIAL